MVTRRGTYLSPDALAYVGTARSLVEGNGYTPPPGAPALSNFPPLYPLVLAAFGALGPDPLTVARFLNPLLFGATVLLVGVAVRRITGWAGPALVAQLLVASGIDVLAYHSSALSEPLFLLLTMLALGAVAASLEPDRQNLVIGAALLAAAACFTRYLGLAVVLAGAAGLVLLASPRQWKTGIAFAVIALAPLAGWLAWVADLEGRATNRSPVLHLPDGDYLLGGVKQASTWFLPSDVPWPLRVAVAAVVVAGLMRAGRSRPAVEELATSAWSRLLVLFALAYLAALAVDRSLFDVTGRLDDRFLLPLHVAAVVAAVAVLSRVDVGASLARVGLSALVGIQVAAGVYWVYDAATDPSVRPGGFAAPAWERSAVLDRIRALPPATPLFSNQVDAVYFHTGRVAQPVPEKRALLTGRVNPDYRSQLAAMLDSLGGDGVVAYFTAPPARRVFLPAAPELAGALRLQTIVRDDVGMLYRRGPLVTGPPA